MSIRTAGLQASSLGGLQARLDAAIVRRTTSLFASDLEGNRKRITDGVSGRRVLVVGGGGSIGSITTRLLLEYAPRAVHVLDISENYLAELIRDLRSTMDLPAGLDLRMLPIDFGGPIAERLIRREEPYDIVLNFAALKHVRSEKDVCSLLQMLDTNIVRQARFKKWIVERGGTTRYFGVSTDKAANPTSLMGASKRLMEDVLFGVAPSNVITVTSARFANVAFSNGSLLQSWLRRLELGQPLVVPRNTRRYFVTRSEAGEICLLSSFLGNQGDIFIPRLDPEGELQVLETLAGEVLRLHGFEPAEFHDEAEARGAVAALNRQGRWPLLLTALDTSGEKPYEEFVGEGEAAYDIGLISLCAVRRATVNVQDFLGTIEDLVSHAESEITKGDIVAAIASAVPSFHHIETGKNLDHRM